jgi:hypothetical protein
MLIIFDINWLRGLARQLLKRAVKLVPHTSLYALTIYAVGCVVPTPLDRQPTPTNYAPTIDVEQTVPFLGALTRGTSDPWAWHVAASDPNTEDTLAAVIMERTATNSFNWVANVTLAKQTQIDPREAAQWSGDSAVTPWCSFFRPGLHNMYVFVSDRMFVGSTEKSDGLVDSNHWELTCS